MSGARSVRKTDPGTGAEVSHESYTNDASSNVISQESGGKTTTFGYDRNRLQTSTTSGVTSSYNYDPFGRLDTVTALNQEIERYVYDGFDRKTEHRTMNAGTATTASDLSRDRAYPSAEESCAYADIGLLSFYVLAMHPRT